MIPLQDTSLTAPRRRLLPGVGAQQPTPNVAMGITAPGATPPTVADYAGRIAAGGTPTPSTGYTSMSGGGANVDSVQGVGGSPDGPLRAVGIHGSDSQNASFGTPASPALPMNFIGRAIDTARGQLGTRTAVNGGPMMPAQPASTPLPQTTNTGYGTLGTIDPTNDLRNQVIAPGQESNRADLAQQYMKTWSENELPQFRAALRGNIQDNAALGRTGSGMLRTDVGNLDLAEQNKYNTAATNFYTDALGNQINDNANQRAELRGERSYQVGQEQSAADRARQQILDEDYLTGSRFGRAATATQLGMAGNPAGVVGGAAADAGNRAAAGAAAVGQSLGSSNYAEMLKKYLEQLQAGAPKPTPTYSGAPAGMGY